MKHDALIECLDKIGAEVEGRYPINYGGCAVFAAAVGHHLNQLEIEAFGIVCDDYIRNLSLTSARQWIKNPKIKEQWNDAGIFFGHVGLAFKYNGEMLHYDSYGVTKAKKKLMNMTIYDGYLTLDELKKIAASTHDWNETFNRRWIPNVKRIVRKHFEYYQRLNNK